MGVRDARPADAKAVAEVARASWHAAYGEVLGTATVDRTVDEWYDTDSLRTEIDETSAADAACFLVAEVDDEVVGFANAGPARDWESDPDDPDAFFSRLYVAPEHWGDGIGSELTARVADELRDAGHERVWLEVFETNERARGFYESIGFERIGSVEETFGGTGVTTLHLSAPLSSVVGATPSVE